MKCNILRSLVKFFSFVVLLASATVYAQTTAIKSAMIAEGKTVAIEFTIYLEDGSVFGGNEGGEPLVYEQGQGNIPAGLETALIGLKADERKKVTLAPEQAYGPVNPEAFVDVETDRIPEDARTIGSVLMVNDPNGNRRYVRVHEVKAETIVIDLNHPLAGKEVTFDVHVLTVE